MSLEAISPAVGEEEGFGKVVHGNFPMGMLTEPGSTRFCERVHVAIVISVSFWNELGVSKMKTGWIEQFLRVVKKPGSK